VTENACTELESGACRGHHYHLQLVELIDAGLIERVRLGAADVAIYESSSMARRTIISAIEELNAASASHAERRKAGRGPDPVPTVLASPDVAERRQLTVMFCDLVGSTALSARLDPEDIRKVIRAYQDACSGAIARYDGFVAKFMGDGVLAYFGFPRAHEEDAERAVRAGLASFCRIGRWDQRKNLI